jgi:hypothetical protein
MSSIRCFVRVFPFLSVAVLGGCATVTRGTTSEVKFESTPSGAAVQTSLNHQCTTPCTIKINRKDEFSATFKLDGYEEQTIPVVVQMAGAGAAGLAGNVLIGGVIGIGVDAATGATLEHVPNPVVVTLTKLGPAPKISPKGKQKVLPKAVPKVEQPKPDGES